MTTFSSCLHYRGLFGINPIRFEHLLKCGLARWLDAVHFLLVSSSLTQPVGFPGMLFASPCLSTKRPPTPSEAAGSSECVATSEQQASQESRKGWFGAQPGPEE
ncbi:hypothetical protein VULLAG_LOCUS16284 [Vulpes lagopus]